jgi:hypothetical protein
VNELPRRFLPESLRPAHSPRRRRRWLAVALLPAIVLPLPWWRVTTVDIAPGPEVPASLRQTVAELEGCSLFTVHLDWIRQRVEEWPGVAAVAVQLRLPSTVQITTRAAPAVASVRVGHGWHGVASDGTLTGRLPNPRPPVMEGFRHRPVELQRGLAVVDRLQGSAGVRVDSVVQILPGDVVVRLHIQRQGPHDVVVHVGAERTAAEAMWCAMIDAGSPIAPWADLRSDSRMVVSPAPGDRPLPDRNPTYPAAADALPADPGERHG